MNLKLLNMKLTNRYILRSHIGPLLFGTLTVMFLFLMQFVIKHIDKLLGKGLDTWIVIQLIVLNLAWMLVLALPMGVLFSTLMAFGNLSSTNEVTIIKASGGSLIRMLLPVAFAGALLAIPLFLFNDKVLPDANHRAKILFSDIKRKKPTFALESSQFYLGISQYTILARHVDSLSGNLYGVTIYDNSQSGKLNIVSADSGIIKFEPDMENLGVLLYNGEIHQMSNFDPGPYKIIEFENYKILIEASGFNLTRTNEEIISRSDRELSIDDMEVIVNESMNKSNESNKRVNVEINKNYDFITGKFTSADTLINDKRLFRAGTVDSSAAGTYDQLQKRLSFLHSSIRSDVYQENEYKLKAQRYVVEIQKKYAIPFACFVFVFLGVPLGILTRRGNFGISAAISLGFFILYWSFLIGGEKLADRGFLSPVLSMWLANIVVGIIGIILTLKVHNESISMPGAKLLRKLLKK